jgi:hypothetical protein
VRERPKNFGCDDERHETEIESGGKNGIWQQRLSDVDFRIYAVIEK